MHAFWRRDPSPIAGTALGLGLIVVLSAAVVPFRGDVSRATPALILVLPVVVAGVTGGRRAAFVVALGSAFAFYVAFIPPYWTLNIDFVDDAVALGVFIAVGFAVGTLVAWEADRRRIAEQRATALAVLNEQYEIVQAERERLLEETTRLAVLEQVDAQRSALLHSVSHDLRTPLAAIKAVASDLRAEADYDEATRKDLLDLVVDETERLDRIVGNLLSMSRIEAGALQPEKQAVALDELAHDCAHRLGRLFQHAQVDLEFPDDLPFADADYSQLDQVVANLLENAARHAPAGSHIHLGGRPAPPNQVQIYVEDEGVGIPPEERSRAFEPFQRGGGSTGSGVGLAICRAMVEANGGSIVIEDGSAGGARVAVNLPVRHG